MNNKISTNEITFSTIILKTGSLLIALSLMLNCGSIWGSEINNNKFGAITFICLIVGFFLCCFSSKININNSTLIGLLFLSVYILFYLFQPININNLQKGFSLYFSFLVLFLYITFSLKKGSLPLAIQYYINIITIVGLISLFFWLFGSVLGFIHSNGIIYSNWGAEYGIPKTVKSYYNLYFETQTLNNITRNSAIFTEAPMASLNFTISFIFQNLFNKNDKYHTLKEIILIISILSTFSSTGYIALLIILVMKTIFTKYKNKNLFLPIVLILSIISLFLIHSLLSSKLGTASGEIRIDDYKAGFEAWKLHPFIGSGINTNAFENFMANWRSNNLGFSNTIMDILVSGGIYLFIPYLISIIYSFIQSLRHHNINNIILIIILCYLFATTIFTNTYILYFLFIIIVINSQFTV